MDDELRHHRTAQPLRRTSAAEERLRPLLSDTQVLDLLFAYSRLNEPSSRRLAVAMLRTLLDAEQGGSGRPISDF
jgi:hypothetical protein